MKAEGVVPLPLHIESLKTHSGWESAPGFDPSTYETVALWSSHCATEIDLWDTLYAAPYPHSRIRYKCRRVSDITHGIWKSIRTCFIVDSAKSRCASISHTFEIQAHSLHHANVVPTTNIKVTFSDWIPKGSGDSLILTSLYNAG